ncbi:MAG: type II toxin-antitoxin system HicB family antitoxin [Burkholderiaceae bacterium]|jgi:predicted HicB family RNase H-like nuclease|nr:type II toxin-antitoxin system HicB family antitoxin [Burkholderiaceae bacterium]
MNNIMTINGRKALIQYDPKIDLFRGEFFGLSGGADFYAPDVEGLRAEGSRSLNVYLAMCREKGIAPYKFYSGRFNVRISPDLHAAAVTVATASGKSLNDFVMEAIADRVR